MASRTESLQGNLVVLELRGLPGEACGDPIPQCRREEIGVCAHAQRQRVGDRSNLGRNRRELSAKGRQRGGAGSAPSVFERGSHPASQGNSMKLYLKPT